MAADPPSSTENESQTKKTQSKSKAEKTSSTKPSVSAVSKVPNKSKLLNLQQVNALTSDDIKEFTDAYEEKKQLNAELKSLDSKSSERKDSKTAI